MKTTIKNVIGLLVFIFLFASCSQKQEQSLEEMLKDSKQQDKVVAIMAENHDLSKKYINKMMESDHSTGMMVDILVSAAAEDFVLAGKLSDMITKFPALMLMTTHHFMPIIAADDHICDGFCDHVMEEPKLAEKMCHKMKESEEKSCCH